MSGRHKYFRHRSVWAERRGPCAWLSPAVIARVPLFAALLRHPQALTQSAIEPRTHQCWRRGTQAVLFRIGTIKAYTILAVVARLTNPLAHAKAIFVDCAVVRCGAVLGGVALSGVVWFGAECCGA